MLLPDQLYAKPTWLHIGHDTTLKAYVPMKIFHRCRQCVKNMEKPGHEEFTRKPYRLKMAKRQYMLCTRCPARREWVMGYPSEISNTRATWVTCRQVFERMTTAITVNNHQKRHKVAIEGPFVGSPRFVQIQPFHKTHMEALQGDECYRTSCKKRGKL